MNSLHIIVALKIHIMQQLCVTHPFTSSGYELKSSNYKEFTDFPGTITKTVDRSENLRRLLFLDIQCLI